jgi:hypothetical protein
MVDDSEDLVREFVSMTRLGTDPRAKRSSVKGGPTVMILKYAMVWNKMNVNVSLLGTNIHDSVGFAF